MVHSLMPKVKLQVPCAPPNFLSSLVALANFVLLKGAHAGVGERSETGNPGPLRPG
jgi:hypothetical protein